MAVTNVAFMELLLTSRRSSHFIWRYLYGGWLVLQFSWIWFLYWLTALVARGPVGAATGTSVSPDATFQFVAEYLSLFLWQQMVLIVLISPAIAAGAITDEKERGTLQYLLTADLSSAELVLGKVVGRLIVIANVFLAGLPFLFVLSSFLGLSLGFLLGVLIHTAAMTFAATSASILSSVWAKRTRDAIVHLYLIIALILLALVLAFQIAPLVGAGGPSPATTTERLAETTVTLMHYLDPVSFLEPELAGASASAVIGRALVSSGGWFALGLACLAVAAWRLRPAYMRQLQGPGKRRAALLWWSRPPVTGEPVRWKERYVTGLAPLPALRYLPQKGVMVLIFLGTTVGVILMTSLCVNGPSNPLMLVTDPGLFEVNQVAVNDCLSWVSVLVLLAASLIVGIRASGAITAEREKHTWEALLMTPLETPSLVRAKLWGIIEGTYPYLAMYAIPMFAFSLLGGLIGIVNFLISLGVTWLAMFYTGATGLWCSARSNSSWRSLVGTLAWAYLGGFLGFVALIPILFTLWVFIALFLELVELVFFGKASGTWMAGWTTFVLAGQIAMALAFLLGSWFFLWEAEKRVADYDRARHWTLEKKRRPKVQPRQVVEYEQSHYD